MHISNSAASILMIDLVIIIIINLVITIIITSLSIIIIIIGLVIIIIVRYQVWSRLEENGQINMKVFRLTFVEI